MTEEKETMNIHQRLLKLVDMAGGLQKSASGFNFKYVPEEEIQAKVTAGMKKYGLMLYPNIVPGTFQVEVQDYEKYDKKMKQNKPVREYLVTAETINRWVNVDNPEEYIDVPWVLVGCMEDASQAFGAGSTYCNRYFLMKSLQLATTEDDPDNYRSKQLAAEKYEEEKAEKEAKAALKEIRDAVVAKGSELIKSGFNKEDTMAIVAKHNNGNGNPSTIKTIEICEAVLKDFNSIKVESKSKEVKKETKESKDKKEAK